MTRHAAGLAAALAVIALPWGAGPLAAQSLDTTLSVRSGTRLTVSNVSGDITVRSWGRQQIRIVAEYDRARVEVDESPGRVSVRTASRRGDAEVTYDITVPSGTPIEAGGVSSDIDVSGVCGSVNLNSVSGDVTLVCARGEVTVQSVSGDVRVTDVRGRLDLGSTSGDVRAENAQGDVVAHSVSGDVELENIETAEASAETVSGDVTYAGRIADRGHYRFEAHSGDVVLRVAGGFNATVTVSTFSGDFDSDFPVTLRPGTRVQREWEFTIGTGSAQVSLRSFSGGIHLGRGEGAGRKHDREREER